MKIAFITPSRLLPKLPEVKGYHLILAQEVLRDLNYEVEYTKRIQRGEYVILDNGAYEKGESISIETFAEIAMRMRPQGIILPDCRFNMKKTFSLLQDAIKYFKGVFPKDYQPRLYAVPQGENLAEILGSLIFYDSIFEIGGIGFYSEIGEVTGLGTRYAFLGYAYRHGYIHPEKFRYHLLGMEEDLSELQRQAHFIWVDGCDSAKPIVCGICGNEILPDGKLRKPYCHRPKDYFDIKEIDADTRAIIRNNIFYVNYLTNN